MFLKENIDGTIKAHGCADGWPQQQYTNKDKTVSLTVSIEALMLSCIIEAKEGRYIVVPDIHGTFLYMDMDDNKDAIRRNYSRIDSESGFNNIQDTQMV